ncbi:uncharacterized protein PpBr36_10592 [Pyricularia pennisetigena]|uniref:uncharacterized protein n=1 Tax=Pyricularia pennisetigena TaxID=1578925 RepID=UPI0011540328|nr:uncharacterized protein PpBr36_10592 [Pyricularia pennisetigena]TLS21158.1 hypothetical protein PpBr36_10592 [Pyricularia pennisetigena]
MDRPKGTKRRFDLFALGCLVATTSHLGSQFDSTSSFARPQYFSIAVFTITAAFCFVLSCLVSNETVWPKALDVNEKPGLATSQIPILTITEPEPRRTLQPLLKSAKHVAAIIKRWSPPTRVSVLLSVVVCRGLLFWHVLRHIQCSWGWIQALLPLSVVLADGLIPAEHTWISLPHVRTDDDEELKQCRLGRHCHGSRNLRLRYAVLAAMWALASAQMTMHWYRPTDVICPRGWRIEQYIPATQVLCLALDAAFLVLTHRLRPGQGSDGVDNNPSSYFSGSCWKTLSFVFATTATIMSFCVWVGSTRGYDAQVHDALDGLEGSDLVGDSFCAAVLLLSVIYLLARIHPATMALILSGLSLYVHRLATRGYDAPWEQMDWTTSTLFPTIMIISAGMLIRWDRDLRPQPRSSASEGVVHRALIFGYLILAGSVLYSTVLGIPDESAVQDVSGLGTIISAAYAESERWQARAGRSKTLEEAVRTYRQQQGIPPPPNFDKWYEFARTKESIIIDDFSQIESDLLPFWGMEPSAIRDMTGQLLEYPKSSMGGLRIQNGEVKLSPNIPGTHLWMVMGMADIIRPFSKWLPDMDLAINLDDECRAAVPFEDQAALQAEARITRSRLGNMGTEYLITSFNSSEASTSKWSDRFMAKDGMKSKMILPPFFEDYHKKPIYRTLVAPACPPDSPARNWRWWNKRDTCLACAAPHVSLTMEGRVVSNWTGAQDVCHQPDMAQLDGFIFSPAAMITTQKMMPVFSQAKVTGFVDILVPSPWNFHSKSPYKESDDMSWDKKQNTVFWRGSATDGFAAAGSWTSFLRARFVDGADALAEQMGPSAGTSGVGLNVSFVGAFPRCEGPDCHAETQHFYENRRSPITIEGVDAENDKASAENKKSSGYSVPFEEHWKFRHLVDLDGAGFSGRFLPFLQSKSLVYRAGLFRTWFDERVHPWRHYVPLDLRLGMGTDAWYSVAAFFGGRRGSHLGEKIALEGREWAQKVTRPADMQVYMFRLLLEWGRIVDDRREALGYFGPSRSSG